MTATKPYIEWTRGCTDSQRRQGTQLILATAALRACGHRVDQLDCSVSITADDHPERLRVTLTYSDDTVNELVVDLDTWRGSLQRALESLRGR